MMNNSSSESEDEEQGYDHSEYLGGQSAQMLDTQELVASPRSPSRNKSSASDSGLSVLRCLRYTVAAYRRQLSHV